MKMWASGFRHWRRLSAIALLMLAATSGSRAQVPALEFTDRDSGEVLSLDHWRGHIVVLDFFAYWCAPCRPASEKIERELAEHYATEGHPHGVPVTVLAVNIESARPDKTQSFIAKTGISHAVDDPAGAALEALKARGLPFLVVLDGTGNDGWKLAYRSNGLKSIAALREAIDAITAPGGDA